jgi:hypothetical protein
MFLLEIFLAEICSLYYIYELKSYATEIPKVLVAFTHAKKSFYKVIYEGQDPDPHLVPDVRIRIWIRNTVPGKYTAPQEDPLLTKICSCSTASRNTCL